MSCDERHFVIKVSVEVSKTFFGWLCGFGKKAKLISPDDVVEKFKLHLDSMQELYKYQNSEEAKNFLAISILSLLLG